VPHTKARNQKWVRRKTQWGQSVMRSSMGEKGNMGGKKTRQSSRWAVGGSPWEKEINPLGDNFTVKGALGKMGGGEKKLKLREKTTGAIAGKMRKGETRERAGKGKVG